MRQGFWINTFNPIQRYTSEQSAFFAVPNTPVSRMYSVAQVSLWHIAFKKSSYLSSKDYRDFMTLCPETLYWNRFKTKLSNRNSDLTKFFQTIYDANGPHQKRYRKNHRVVTHPSYLESHWLVSLNEIRSLKQSRHCRWESKQDYRTLGW